MAWGAREPGSEQHRVQANRSTALIRVDLRLTGVRAVALQEEHVERAQDAIEAHGELATGRPSSSSSTCSSRNTWRARTRRLSTAASSIRNARLTAAREAAKSAQRERERALDRNRGVAADEHHLQQVFVAIRDAGDASSSSSASLGATPPPPDGIDHAAPGGDLQPGARTLGNVRTPALDRGHEDVLDGSLD